jgi:preprotein translocase subunit SecE
MTPAPLARHALAVIACAVVMATVLWAVAHLLGQPPP